MNPADYPKFLPDGPVGAYVNFLFWFAANPAQAWAIVLGYSAITICSIFHCLHSQRGIDRLTWFIVIGTMPILGVVFYWCLHETPDSDARLGVFSTRSTPPPPPPKNVAAEVNDSISEMIQKRRSGQ